MKNHQGEDSYSVSETAGMLGVSIPTVKRMVEDGLLEAFRTPGGHRRVLAESVEAVKDQRQAKVRPVRGPSPVLQNRRERLEELTLEAQEHRARHELEKLRRQEQAEAEQLEAEAQARTEAAERRRREIELGRERLKHEKTLERLRQQKEREQECQRREAERELATFRQRWQDKAAEAVTASQYRWLSAGQRKEILEGLEAEIDQRQPADEPRMPAIVARTLAALVEPLQAERDAQERRQKLTEEALRSLPYSATEAEKVRARTVIEEVLRHLDHLADVCKMRTAVTEAIQPARQAIERRLLDERLITWALRQLPWSRTEFDIARIRRECAEIIADLPADVSEPEAKEALEPTVREACAEIQERQVDKERRGRKAGLVQSGVAEVSSYLLSLAAKREISDKEYWDSDLTADLTEAVRLGLEAKLKGDETTKEVRQQAQKIVDDQLD
ncbi:MAG TPA: helix-turn-helix domain-containing protein [Terriglobia bacterium]|nr:helix-turn-helix domain-containing protein [Terriglobia bacterium]